LIVSIDKPVNDSGGQRKSSARHDGLRCPTHPPRQAKQAMPKTLMFLTSAIGPDAPVRAWRRARAAPSMTESERTATMLGDGEEVDGSETLATTR